MEKIGSATLPQGITYSPENQIIKERKEDPQGQNSLEKCVKKVI
jgi:hypothetical protein